MPNSLLFAGLNMKIYPKLKKYSKKSKRVKRNSRKRQTWDFFGSGLFRQKTQKGKKWNRTKKVLGPQKLTSDDIRFNPFGKKASSAFLRSEKKQKHDICHLEGNCGFFS